MDEKNYKEAIAGLIKDKSQRAALAELLVEYIEPKNLANAMRLYAEVK